MRIDAHQHYWSPEHGDYGWLVPSPELAPICRPFGPADLWPQLDAAGIDGTVLVQAAPSEAETIRLLDIAAQPDSRVLGVVGWCDLEAHDAAARIAGLAAQPLLKGLRPMLQDIPDPGWILQARLEPALHAMESHGLVLDLLVKPHQLDACLQLALRRPGLRMVLDHAAKPAIGAGTFEPWAHRIACLARMPHVHCKLSGLLTEAPSGAGVRELRRFVDHVLDIFGPSRILWGSDWPVLTLAASYGRWHALSLELTQALGSAQRDLVFGGNAERLYEIGCSPRQPGAAR